MALSELSFGAGEITSLVVAVLGFFGIALGAYLAYRFALRQSRIQHNKAIRTDLLRREIDALESVWALLVYLSDKKSAKAIIHWQRDSKAGTTQYFYHFANLEYFMLHGLSEVFYQKHAGLFISKEVRDLLYAYRSVVAGFYFSHRKAAEGEPEPALTLIEKPEQVEKLKSIYAELNACLRADLERCYQRLQV